MQLSGFQTTRIDVKGANIEIATRGEGRPILFLHPGHGLFGAGPALERLAQLGRVIAPSHPGFGGSDLPASITTVDDLSYFYLDLLESLALDDAVLVGASFGGWIAAELAVKCTSRIGHLVLVDSVGIKVGDREARDIADIHAVDDMEALALMYSDPVKYGPDYATLPDADLMLFAKNSESLALFAWRPYMHNPKLRNRLSRIRVPTLVLWGENDRIVTTAYGRAFSLGIPGSRFETVASAGHLSFLEQPDSFATKVGSFVNAVRH